jgi:hypothetical protein
MNKSWRRRVKISLKKRNILKLTKGRYEGSYEIYRREGN